MSGIQGQGRQVSVPLSCFPCGFTRGPPMSTPQANPIVLKPHQEISPSGAAFRQITDSHGIPD